MQFCGTNPFLEEGENLLAFAGRNDDDIAMDRQPITSENQDASFALARLAMGHYTRVTQAVSRVAPRPSRKPKTIKRQLEALTCAGT
jgi:hypothetical protein